MNITIEIGILKETFPVNENVEIQVSLTHCTVIQNDGKSWGTELAPDETVKITFSA